MKRQRIDVMPAALYIRVPIRPVIRGALIVIFLVHLQRCLIGFFFLLRRPAFPVIVHPRSTIRAVYQAGQRIRKTNRIRPVLYVLHALSQGPCFLIDNGLMGVLHDDPFFRRKISDLLILIRFLLVPQVYRMPEILLLGNQFRDGRTGPVIRTGHIRAIDTDSTLRLIN